MGYMVSAVLLTIAVVNYMKERTFAAPITFFCIEWGMITLFASMRLFTLYEASARTWLIILLGAVSYVIGASLGEKIRVGNKLSVSKSVPCIESSSIKIEKSYYMLLAFLFLLELPGLLECVSLLRQGVPMSSIRLFTYGQLEIEGYSSAGGAFYHIKSIVAPVIELFVLAWGITTFLSNVRKNRRAIIFLLLYEVIRAVTTGGRFIFAYIAIELFVCFEIFRKKNVISFKLSKRTKKILFWVFIVLAIFIVIISSSRSIGIDDLFEHLYMYICGNVVLLDKKLNVFATTDFWSLGFASLNGFWMLLFTYLFPVLGIQVPDFIDRVDKIVMTGQANIQVGDNLYMNAFVTPYYYLYADFRIIGVIVGMIFFGAICGYFYKKVKKQVSIENVVFYLIVSQMIFKTLQTYPLASSTYMLGLLVYMVRRVRIR